MIYIQINEEQEVIFFHKDPLHPVYGLNKTEEELKETGYLIDYLKDIPRPEPQDGFRSITYSDGEKFWFNYVKLDETLEEKYMKELEAVQLEQQKQLVKHQAIADKAEATRVALQTSQENLELVSGEATLAKEMADISLTDGAMLIMEMLKKEEAIESQRIDLEKQKEQVNLMSTSLEAERVKIEEAKEKIAETMEFLDMTTEESAMMTMALMDMDYTMLKTKEATDKVVVSIKETEAFVEKTKNEIIVLKDEVALGTNESATITMAMLEIDMKLNDKQFAIDEIKKNIATIKEVQANLLERVGKIEASQLETKAFKDDMTTKVTKLLADQASMMTMYTENKSGLEVVRRGFQYYENEKTVMRNDIETLKKEKSAFEIRINEMVLQDANELVKTKAELASTKAQLDELQTNVVELTRRLNEGGIA